MLCISLECIYKLQKRYTDLPMSKFHKLAETQYLRLVHQKLLLISTAAILHEDTQLLYHPTKLLQTLKFDIGYFDQFEFHYFNLNRLNEFQRQPLAILCNPLCSATFRNLLLPNDGTVHPHETRGSHGGRY